jgi:hypothetical protein
MTDLDKFQHSISFRIDMVGCLVDFVVFVGIEDILRSLDISYDIDQRDSKLSFKIGLCVIFTRKVLVDNGEHFDQRELEMLLQLFEDSPFPVDITRDIEVFSKDMSGYPTLANPFVIPIDCCLHLGRLDEGVHDDELVVLEGHFDLLSSDGVELDVETGILLAQVRYRLVHAS